MDPEVRDPKFAMAHAVTAYRLATDINNTNEDSDDEAGEWYDIDGEETWVPTVNMNSTPVPVKPAEANEQIVRMCIGFRMCYPMFAGNHAQLPQQNSGSLRPGLCCPFGSKNTKWREGTIYAESAGCCNFTGCDSFHNNFLPLLHLPRYILLDI